MEFLPGPQHPPGPPTMDLEEPKGPEVPSENHPSNTQSALGPGGPVTLSEMELDTSSVQENPDAGGLLSAEAGGDDLLGLLRDEASSPAQSVPQDPAQTAPRLLQPPEDPDGDPGWMEGASAEPADSRSSSSSPEPWLETAPLVTQQEPPVGTQSRETLASCPAVTEVPGPCGPEELMDGVIFGAKYLGSTQLLSERSPAPSTRMGQAQEAMDRVKAPEGETQPMVEVDIFISTKRVKVLAADSQDALMDHALQTISYIADIGPVLVLMARRRLARRTTPQDRQRRLSSVTLSIIHCPPVTTAVIRRPHVREQLGFCVEDGIICSLLRGGAAERGGVRVGHRIIEVNGQSVVAMPHARIIQLLTETREIHIKTMPAATYRLLTGQEQPVYL